MVGVRGESPSMPCRPRGGRKTVFVSRWGDQMGLIACSTRNKKRCEVIGYESTRTRFCTYWLLIRITFGIPLSPHSFDSLDIGLSEENPIGRVSDFQALSSLRDADCITCIMTLWSIIYVPLCAAGSFCMYKYVSRGKTYILRTQQDHICFVRCETRVSSSKRNGLQIYIYIYMYVCVLGSSNCKSFETPYKHKYFYLHSWDVGCIS